MYVVSQLNREQLASYAELTFPSLREELLGEPKKAAVVAVGASWFGKPIGLIWGYYWADLAAGRIRTIFVTGNCRRRGVGAAMLREMESAMGRLGCKELFFEYRYDPDRSTMWERLFRKSGWDRKHGSLHTFTASISRFLELDWVRRRSAGLPEGFAFFSWGDLTEAERTVVKAGEGAWYPAGMSPMFNEKRTEPNLSVGLRFGTDIIGWTIIHDYDDDTVVGDRMYVRPPYQAQGRAVLTMVESVRRIAEAGYPLVRFDVSGNNKPMLRFVERRMKPSLVEAYEMVRMNKEMADNGL